MSKAGLYLVLLAALLAGCSSEAGPGNGPGSASVEELPQPTTGPYVSVAVDNHFHDIHPESNIEIAADRPFVVENEGRNLHNVSISGTGIRRNIEPGDRFRLDPVGSRLPPGLYTVICRFHASQGMTGQFRVVAADG